MELISQNYVFSARSDVCFCWQYHLTLTALGANVIKSDTTYLGLLSSIIVCRRGKQNVPVKHKRCRPLQGKFCVSGRVYVGMCKAFLGEVRTSSRVYLFQLPKTTLKYNGQTKANATTTKTIVRSIDQWRRCKQTTSLWHHNLFRRVRRQPFVVKFCPFRT